MTCSSALAIPHQELLLSRILEPLIVGNLDKLCVFSSVIRTFCPLIYLSYFCLIFLSRNLYTFAVVKLDKL